MIIHNSPLLSIIVPAYQVEAYLVDCIESVENQDFKDYEIIIVDDGSMDNTPMMADELVKKYSNICVIHQMNQGLSEARNSGIKIAKGKYCVLLDGDDMFLPNSLKKLAECIEANQIPDVVVSRFCTMDSETGETKDVSFQFNTVQLKAIKDVSEKFKRISHYWLAGWLFCVRLDYLRQYNLYFQKGLLHEDEEWMPRVALHAQTMAFNNVPYYCYRLNRKGSITCHMNVNRMFDSIKIVTMLSEELQDNTYSAQAKKVMLYRIQTILFGTINKVSLYRKHERYSEMIRMLEEQIYILKNSQRIVYRVSYWMCKMIGVKMTGRILQKLVELKK